MKTRAIICQYLVVIFTINYTTSSLILSSSISLTIISAIKRGKRSPVGKDSFHPRRQPGFQLLAVKKVDSPTIRYDRILK